MSRYFPTSVYAEDQPLAHTILTTHVLYRGFQTGGALGLITGTSTYLYKMLRSGSRSGSVPTSGQFGTGLKAAINPAFSNAVLRQAGISAIVSVPILAVGLSFMMKDREEIEWEDRSWRLMHNEGQLSVDDWSMFGGSAGLVSSITKKGQNNFRLVAGRTVIGSLAGVVGYIVFRYGIKSRKE